MHCGLFTPDKRVQRPQRLGRRVVTNQIYIIHDHVPGCTAADFANHFTVKMSTFTVGELWQ